MLDCPNSHARSGADKRGERLAVRSLEHTTLAFGNVTRLERELEVFILVQNVEAFRGPAARVSDIAARNKVSEDLQVCKDELLGHRQTRQGLGGRLRVGGLGDRFEVGGFGARVAVGGSQSGDAHDGGALLAGVDVGGAEAGEV